MSVNISIGDRGVDLQMGRGAYRVRVEWHGRGAWLLRVPFLGKAWSYPGGGVGRMGWAEVVEEEARGLGD